MIRRTLAALALAAALPAAAADLPLQSLRLPPGFSISVYAELPGPRNMTLGRDGTVYVGSMDDEVRALVNRDGDGRADRVVTVARGLNKPNGVAYRDGSLYVGEIGRVLRFDGVDQDPARPAKPVVVYDKLPRDGHHGWKFIAFGPDGYLYVPVGAPCNICEPDPDRYALLGRLRPDGSGWEVYARGIRNTVGFDWHPQTRELWFNDHGRDHLGDDLPSCELNHAPRPGMHFGYPYCHQGDTPDPQYGRKRACSEFTPPALNQGGHVAPDGLRFYAGKMFPPEYRNRLFIAQHGSWNRSEKSGYRVMMVSVEGGKAVKYEPFVEGWLSGQSNWGRPVDLLVMPDGALLISDDQAGVVYRVSYRKP